MFGKSLSGLIKNQKGQTLLVIVLIMVVALTVGLSLASRTITNIRNTREQVSSQKALSAAEAGIERAIKKASCTGLCAEGVFSGNTNYSTTVTQVLGDLSFLLNGGKIVSKNDATYVWVTSPLDQNNLWQNPWSGNLTIYWGNPGEDCNNASNRPAALEVAVISGTVGAPVMTRRALDPCPTRVATSNNFNVDSSLISANSTKISNVTPLYKAVFCIGTAGCPIAGKGLLVRINPIYADSVIGAAGAGLPSQGVTITSTGTSDDNIKRTVTVFQGYPEVPAEFFPYILFQP
nr:hypothetical protein [Candidatus Levybacteria bacterium]